MESITLPDTITEFEILPDPGLQIDGDVSKTVDISTKIVFNLT